MLRDVWRCCGFLGSDLGEEVKEGIFRKDLAVENEVAMDCFDHA